MLPTIYNHLKHPTYACNQLYAKILMEQTSCKQTHATNLMNRLYFQTLNNINKFLHNHVRH